MHKEHKEQVRKVLTRAGIQRDSIDEVMAELPCEIDLDRLVDVLARRGITPGVLTDLLGGSP